MCNRNDIMTEKLKVSLITTVYNEAKNIDNYFDSISRQTVLPDEIIIVDAGSHDGTIERIWESAGELKPRVKVIVEEGCNISAGRNLAIRHCCNDIIACTDAGTVMDPDWLFYLVKPFGQDPSLDVVGGYYIPVLHNQLQRAVFYGFCWTRKVDPETYLPSSRSIAFKKSAWRKVGGYPEWLDYGEDTYFNISMKKAGLRFYFQDKSIVGWEPRDTLRKTILQHYRYGRGDGKAAQLLKEGYARFFADFVFRVLLLLLSLKFTLLIVVLCLEITLMTIRYRIARIFFSKEEYANKLKASFLSLIVSPIVETAMVVGYIQGFIIRWKRNLP